jgi:hypothetical protein
VEHRGGVSDARAPPPRLSPSFSFRMEDLPEVKPSASASLGRVGGIGRVDGGATRRFGNIFGAPRSADDTLYTTLSCSAPSSPYDIVQSSHTT